jgi:hypothetical protein
VSMEGLLWVEADTDVKVSSYSCEDEVARLRKRLINAENFLQMQVLFCNSVAIYMCNMGKELVVSSPVCFWQDVLFCKHGACETSLTIMRFPTVGPKLPWCSHS